MTRSESGRVMPFLLSENESSPAPLQLEKLVASKRGPVTFEMIVLASRVVRHPCINSVRTTPTRTRRSASIRASISLFSGDPGWLKNGIQTEVSAMTTPAPLLFLLRFQLMLFQLLPAIGNADLPGQGLQPFELLPADELRDGQVDGLGFRLRPGHIHQLLDQVVIKPHGGAHRIHLLAMPLIYAFQR